MRRSTNRFSPIVATIVWITWGLGAGQEAGGSEFRFLVKDLSDNTAAWLPNHVVIHQETDLSGGLIFLLENPTARTHVFFVEGLQEQIIDENGTAGVRPLRVTIAPEETVRAVVSMGPFQMVHADTTEHQFYCPLHRGDSDPGGTIQIVHHGGTIQMTR